MLLGVSASLKVITPTSYVKVKVEYDNYDRVIWLCLLKGLSKGYDYVLCWAC